MPVAQLISPHALNERQAQPGLVILDCRFALEDPDYGRCSYAEGHIAGAQFADLERDSHIPFIQRIVMSLRSNQEGEQARFLVKS